MNEEHAIVRIAIDKDQWKAFKDIAKANHRTANGEIRKMISEKVEIYSIANGRKDK